MGRSRRTAVATALAVLAGWIGAVAGPAGTALASTSAERAALAQWWAPVHFQDVDTSGETAEGGKSDYLTSYDFDGDLNGRNNWENISEFPLAAHVYYSVVQTPSFSYLLYMFFHPRDWADAALDDYMEDATEHENDSEGALVVVANDGSEHGSLKAVITVAHSNFYSWLPEGSDFASGNEDVDGAIATLASPHGDGHQRPWTAQQASTHAAWAMGATRKPSPDLGDQYRNGDGILYNPGSSAEVPDGPNDRDVQYTLTDIFASGGMWDNRYLTSLFATPDNFAGDDSGNPHGAACGDGAVAGPAAGDCKTDAANPPWAWDDADDGPGKGYIATNPAVLVHDYFDWPGKPGSADVDYTWNPYNGVTPSDPPPPSSRAGRVLVVGDSITNGFEGDYTWRYRLWEWARRQDIGATFVGPLTGTEKPGDPHPPEPPPIGEGGGNPAPSEPDPAQFTGAYNRDVAAEFVNGGSGHYAMWGRQLVQDVGTIKGVMTDLGAKGQMPDLLVVELGFNDIGWLGAGAGLTTAMKSFIDNARAANQNVRFVLGNVPHRTTLGSANPQLPQRITDYNAALAREIPNWSTTRSPIVLADVDGEYRCDSSATTCPSAYDGLHPNALGEYRIARAFGKALHDGFHLGSGAPEVPSTVPARPVATPTSLAFDGTQQGVTVTWPKVFGAHNYDIQWRDTTGNASAEWVAAGTPFNRFDLSWQFTNQPVEGHTYEVRARAVAGDSDSLKSGWSSVVGGTAHPRTTAPPATVHASAGAGSLHVAWTPPPGPYTDSINRYALWVYDQDTPTVYSRIIGYDANTRVADVGGVTPGHHYAILLCAWNAYGEGHPYISESLIPS
ncbi:GDSL-type esterase/lipase family protein [Mangrovihabitans endophyticus]|uniref:GDSL-type esterase/lipase family protein n=1 Tax=Mangrovihabitans endophyticus TaxID=1751298 RepID=UPI00166592A3|nr:GDSL-type esterase/lipase family protein [Mangrovihabitans endophyticus]